MKLQRRRVSHAERSVLRLIAHYPEGCQMSLDSIAGQIDYDRRTVAGAIARLRTAGQIAVAKGSGNRPNCYRLVA
jgi:DNA-binding MarR family transcriptional regulator